MTDVSVTARLRPNVRRRDGGSSPGSGLVVGLAVLRGVLDLGAVLRLEGADQPHRRSRLGGAGRGDLRRRRPAAGGARRLPEDGRRRCRARRRAGRHRRPRNRHPRADARRRDGGSRRPTSRARTSCRNGKPITGPTSPTAGCSPKSLRESGENLPFYETQVSGIPVSEKLEVFAADNRMPTCSPPRDLTR